MTLKNNFAIYCITLLCFNSFLMGFSQEVIYEHGIDKSDTSTVNINVPRGIKYQHYKRAVAFISGDSNKFRGSIRVNSNINCTATLLNTVNQNGTLYLLTAAHCLYKDNNVVIGEKFKFLMSYNREALPPTSRTKTQNNDRKVYFIQGTIVALDSVLENDMVLIRLKGLPKNTILENVYFSGWNLSRAAVSVASISHPRGDLKKIYEWSEFPCSINYIPSNSKVPKILYIPSDSKFPKFLNHTFVNLCFSVGSIDFPNVVANGEPGTSGAGLLDEYSRVMGVQSSGSDISNIEFTIYNYLGASWIKRVNSYNNEYPYYSFPKKEVPNFQKFLDPNSTYVSQIPGGYGFYNNINFKIDDAAFDLTLEAGRNITTPGFGPENSTDDMIKLNIWELLQKDPTTEGTSSTLLDVINKGGVYFEREEEEGDAFLAIWMYPENDKDKKELLLHVTLNNIISDEDRGHFRGYTLTKATESRLREVASSIGINTEEPSEFKLPVVIKIVNISRDKSMKIKALRIPGLGYRNAVELFKPDQFKELYKNHSYPDSYGSTGTATTTKIHERFETENTMLSAILYSTEIKPTPSNTSTTNPYKFVTDDNGGYINLLQHTIRLEANEIVQLTYTSFSSTDQKHLAAWIDYNQSRNYEDAGEQVVSIHSTTAKTQTTFRVKDIDNPQGITTRMRLGYRTEGDLPVFANQNFTNGEIEDYSVHIYKNTKEEVTATGGSLEENLRTGNYYLNKAPEVNEGASTSTAPDLCLEPVAATAAQGTSSQVADTSLSFTNFVDPSGGYNTNSCQTLKITPHPEAATNGLYALSFGRAENTRYIAIDLNREREPTPFLEDTLLSYGLTAIKSDTPNYLQISRLNSDTSKLVFKHAQYDAYSFSYTLTPTYQYNSPIDELENSIAQSHNNTTIVNKAAAIGGTVGTTVVGVAAVGVYAYKSINQTVASAEEQIPLTRSGEVVSEVRQGVFQRVKNFFVRAYKYCTGKLD